MPTVSLTSLLVGYESSITVRTRAAVASLVGVLAGVGDPRSRFGRRYPLANVLALIVAAGLANATRATLVAEWAGDQAAEVRAGFGFARRWPSVRTISRIMERVDAGQVDQALSGWVAARDPGHVAGDPDDGDSQVTGQVRPEQEPAVRPVRDRPVRGLAFDGKTMRGARRRRVSGSVVQDQMLAATWHDSGVVAGQVVIEGEDEIGALPVLVTRLAAAGQLDRWVCVTADAKHAQHETVKAIRDAGAHYTLTIKSNQPSLHDALAALPWPKVGGVSSEDRAHGRIEQRTVKALTPGVHLRGFWWRDVAQVAQIRRRTWRKKTPTAQAGWTTETVYIITSLPAEQATTAEIGDLVRGQWVIEDRVHHVRDAVMGEDKHTCRTGNAPAVWATIRNTAISLLRHAGQNGIAAATRSNNRDPERILTLITG